MSIKVFIEMPLGNRSQPHEEVSEDRAMEVFARMAHQMRPWKNFIADVVMLDEHGKEIHREHISNGE
jgi:hypothetical protein